MAETPRFYMYRPPEGGKVGKAIQSALSTMSVLQKMRSEGLTQEEARARIAREAEERPLDIRAKQLLVEKAEKTLPLELTEKQQKILREEQELPLEIQKKHDEHLEAMTKPDYWRTETELNQAQTRLAGAQQQEHSIKATREAVITDLIRAINAPEVPTQPSVAPGMPTQVTRPSAPPIAQPIAPELPLQPTATGMPEIGMQVKPPFAGMQAPPQQLPFAGMQMAPKQQKMMQLADTLAMLEGKTPPSVELANKAQSVYLSEQAKNQFSYGNALLEAQGKDMAEAAKLSAQRAGIAQNNINQLSQFLKYTDIAKIKGPLAAYFSGIAKWDPGYVDALKSTAQLQLSGIANLATSKVGRILEMEVEMLSRGIPDPSMPPEAAKEIANMLKVQNEAVIARNDMFQDYKNLIPDSTSLSRAIDNIMLQNNYVDPRGNMHPEAIKDWSKVATKERIIAEAAPREFEDKFGTGLLEVLRNKSARDAIPAPKGISEENIANLMNKYGRTRRQVINDLVKRYNIP